MRRKNDHGSILMETVLVIPLYLAFLSGVFWLGDLALLRSKSTFFDRLAAWGSGNRQQPFNSQSAAAFIQSNFLRFQDVGQQGVSSLRLDRMPGNDEWSALYSSTADVSINPPPWTDGWRRAALTMMEGSGGLSPVTFRSREINAEFMHRNLMRARNKFRENSTPESLSKNLDWLNKVYALKWPEWPQKAPSAVNGASPCVRYDRHSAYVQWSE